jgi:hypothetical protein
MSSTAEAEIGAVFINIKEEAVLRTTLEEIGNKQTILPQVIFLSFGMFFSLMKKHVSVPEMSRIPWNRRPHSLPKPRVHSGCSRGSFMSAEYSISFPVTGWMTALAWCCFYQ